MEFQFGGCKKEVIKTRAVLKPQGEGVKARIVLKHFITWQGENNGFHAGTPTPVSLNFVLALAAKRVALGKSQTIACLDVSTASLHAEMRNEVYIKFDAYTLSCTDIEAHHDAGRTPWQRQRKILDSNRAISTVLCTWTPETSSSTRLRTTNFSQETIVTWYESWTKVPCEESKLSG